MIAPIVQHIWNNYVFTILDKPRSKLDFDGEPKHETLLRLRESATERLYKLFRRSNLTSKTARYPLPCLRYPSVLNRKGNMFQTFLRCRCALRNTLKHRSSVMPHLDGNFGISRQSVCKHGADSRQKQNRNVWKMHWFKTRLRPKII